MNTTLPPLPEDWQIAAPCPVAQTGIATVWKVTSRWGAAALKGFHGGDARNEARAPEWLAAMAGSGVVRCHAQTQGAVLLEWLDGPLLGARSRSGEDARACEALARLARDLRTRRPKATPDLPDLATWIAPLFTLSPNAGWTAADRQALEEGKHLAGQLLDTAPPACLLHGDLHFDNIIETGAGPVAIDPKGLWGDPAYELANAFRNPKGFAGCLSPEVQQARLSIFAQHSGLPAARLAGWAMVKCLLSSAWAGDDAALVRFNLDVLQALRSAFRDLGGIS